jgi:hypothetical protein
VSLESRHILINRKQKKKNTTENKMESTEFLNLSKKINLITTVIVIIFGLVGNFVTILVFSQKRFRTNPSNSYLFILAIIDTLFLVIHFFEDTIRTWKDILLSSTTTSNNATSITQTTTTNFINLINITDQYEISCKLINFLRYSLRLISAYIVVAFTIQRLFIVSKPFAVKYKSKKIANRIIFLIIMISFLLNIWIPFLFELRKNQEDIQYCDIKKMYRNEYFKLSIAYIIIIIIIPILIIMISNLIIISKAFIIKSNRSNILTEINNNNNNEDQKSKKKFRLKNRRNATFLNSNSKTKSKNENIKPYYLTENQRINKENRNAKFSTKKITILLLIVSFSYVILNLPYLITWMFFYKNVVFVDANKNDEDYLFGYLQIAEVFLILYLLFYLKKVLITGL